MTTPHKHADNMLLFAQDAQTTENPWALWQRLPQETGVWCGMTKGWPMWHEKTGYRRKPPAQKYITIGDREVPEPLRVAPELNTHYWYISAGRVYSDLWHSGTNKLNISRLRSGMVHLTESAAKLHLDAIIRINNQPGH
jgi:hypothetical protein